MWCTLLSTLYTFTVSVGCPYHSDLSGLNRDLRMSDLFFYILYRLHPFHVLLCNLMFLMMLYNNFSFVSNLSHEWYECMVDLNITLSESVVRFYTKNALID